jgi:anaerobic magnesium-protoporphyrin IX monomethyl ester cyclase
VKVILAYLCNYRDRKDYYLSLMPYGLTSIAAYLQERDFTVTLANFSGQGPVRAARWIARQKPEVLGVSLFAFNRSDSLRLIEEVGRLSPQTVIVAGGPFAHHYHRELLDRFGSLRHVVRGEGEEAMHRLLLDIQQGRPARGTVEGERIRHLDDLPFASSFNGTAVGMDPLEQYSFMITSRGCPGACTYCCSPSFWGRTVAFRSPENIADEMERLYRERGIIYFSIRDDNFTLRKERVMEFSRLLRSRGVHVLWNCQARVDTVDLEMILEMKKAGLEHIQYGVESGSARILGMMDKRTSLDAIQRAAGITRSAGVLLSVYLMAGMPGETADDFEETLKLVGMIRPHDGIVSPVALYPGTALFDDLAGRGDVDDDLWFSRSDSGMYARHEPEAARWVTRLAKELSRTGGRSAYTAAEFREHRRLSDGESWVTDLMEGDQLMAVGQLKRAGTLYRRVAERMPENPWGHLKAGECALCEGKTREAIRAYRAAAGALPTHYGSWLALAELYAGLGDLREARACAERAVTASGGHRGVMKRAGGIVSG